MLDGKCFNLPLFLNFFKCDVTLAVLRTKFCWYIKHVSKLFSIALHKFALRAFLLVIFQRVGNWSTKIFPPFLFYLYVKENHHNISAASQNYKCFLEVTAFSSHGEKGIYRNIYYKVSLNKTIWVTNTFYLPDI